MYWTKTHWNLKTTTTWTQNYLVLIEQMTPLRLTS